MALDGFVFIDDNPAERAIVASPVTRSIAVPDVGDNVTGIGQSSRPGRYFEPASLSNEDLERSASYANNKKRSEFEAKFINYGDYLDSLRYDRRD